ncbi:hypothetical protein DVH24_033925 [Malus domestica]|uniref:Uncharacterized protein n=1 Tax=Malus domestica TaxID=3750 RepID=A0A498KNF3_MALDO|nr:hypothetical protein DVH24_033925 [Malus domestica]
MGDPLGSSRLSSQKQNREGVAEAQNGQYCATAELPSSSFFALKVCAHKFSPGVLGSPPSSYPNSQKAPESCQSTLKISQGILGSHPPLTEYYEYCWPNDGCFSGCNHAYGRKRDYIPIEYDVTNDMTSEGAGKERIESMFGEKLEMVATKKAILSIELYDLQNHIHHTPLIPSFQWSDHEINVSTSLCHSTIYLPSLESDLTIKSSDEKLTRLPLGNLETGGILLETSNALSDIFSYHWQEDYDNIGKLGEMHTLSRLCDGRLLVHTRLSLCLTRPLLSQTQLRPPFILRRPDWLTPLVHLSDSLNSASLLRPPGTTIISSQVSTPDSDYLHHLFSVPIPTTTNHHHLSTEVDSSNPPLPSKSPHYPRVYIKVR